MCLSPYFSHCCVIECFLCLIGGISPGQGLPLLPSIHRFTCFHMENKCAERYHLIAVTSAKVGMKQTASSQVSEQRDGMPPSDKERKKREGEKRAQQTIPS
jgi:hypothetical protein